MKKVMRTLLATMLLSVAPIHAHYKIVYLISPPRSLSVAFLRMMQARGDFTIMHEPSNLAFNLQFAHKDTVKEWYQDTTLQTTALVQQTVLHAAQTRPVFVKEMSFAFKNFLKDFPELMQDPDIHFVFLIRNPHHSVISFYKKQTSTIVDDKLSFLIGYQACYELYQEICTHARNKPLILRTEDLYTNPRATIEQFCAHVGIEFFEHALSWENLGEDFTGAAWHETKKEQQTHHWHDAAIISTHFTTPATYTVDADGKPTFAEIHNEQHLRLCKQAYEDNMVYYQLMLALATFNNPHSCVKFKC